jgi:hypothetical protein
MYNDYNIENIVVHTNTKTKAMGTQITGMIEDDYDEDLQHILKSQEANMTPTVPTLIGGTQN